MENIEIDEEAADAAQDLIARLFPDRSEEPAVEATKLPQLLDPVATEEIIDVDDL